MYKYLPYIITFIMSIFGASAQIFFKKAMPIKFNIIELITNYWLVFGMIFYGIAFIGYLLVLKYAPVSKLYPIIAFSYLFVCILSWIFLKESITFLKVIGNIGIIVSVYLIVR